MKSGIRHVAVLVPARDEEALLPLPARGRTPERHGRLLEVAREDVSLAKVAEAH